VTKKNISNPFINWSAHCPENCIDHAIKKQNVPMVEFLFKAQKHRKWMIGRVSLPVNQLKVSTGYLGDHTFGHAIKKVQASQGGKEGNNAFIYDDHVITRSLEDYFNLAIKIGSYPILETLMKENNVRVVDQVAEGLMYKVAERGHLELTRKFATLLNDHPGLGLNELHVKVLSENENEELPKFGNTSVTKMAMQGNFYVTPLHLAAINPNIKFLKALVEQSNIIDATDDLKRTPIFFCCCMFITGTIKIFDK